MDRPPVLRCAVPMPRTPLILAVALGCGLSAGVFFAFSAFVLPALSSLPDDRSVAAMQAINVKAVTAPLMLLLFGTAAGCVWVALRGARRLGEPGAGLVLAGAIVFLIGTIGVTVAGNVPLNDALERAGTRDPARAWSDFEPGWMVLNHLRTVASTAAAALLAAGAVAGAA